MASPPSFASTMVRRRSPKAAEQDAKVEQVIAALSWGNFSNVNQIMIHFDLYHTTFN
jgi:hypothetical protein